MPKYSNAWLGGQSRDYIMSAHVVSKSPNSLCVWRALASLHASSCSQDWSWARLLFSLQSPGTPIPRQTCFILYINATNALYDTLFFACRQNYPFRVCKQELHRRMEAFVAFLSSLFSFFPIHETPHEKQGTMRARLRIAGKQEDRDPTVLSLV